MLFRSLPSELFRPPSFSRRIREDAELYLAMKPKQPSSLLPHGGECSRQGEGSGNNTTNVDNDKNVEMWKFKKLIK